jgi:lysozyme family protein
MVKAMTAKLIAIRTASAFVLAATSTIPLGAVMDVAVWKTAVMAGVAAVLNILQKLAKAYRDGKLTAEELPGIFE